jgi:hypothetical protein
VGRTKSGEIGLPKGVEVGPWRVILAADALDNGSHFGALKFRPYLSFTS